MVSAEELFVMVPELKTIDRELCVKCKAVQLLCGMKTCPILKAYSVRPKLEIKAKQLTNQESFFGPSPQIFVGSKGYPRVRAGPSAVLFPDETDVNLVNNPSEWRNLSLDEIIELRFGLVRGMKPMEVKPKATSIDEKIASQLQEIALSTNPVDVEGKLSGGIALRPKIDPIAQPFGPSAEISKFKVIDNPKIPPLVERTLSDELSSTEQLKILQEGGLDVYYLQNAFSSGAFGKYEERKVVPTRWSITAVDDTMGKILLAKIRDFPSVNQIMAFRGGLYGNYFTILMFPGAWLYENFEAWASNSIYTLGTKGFLSLDSEGFDAQRRYKGRGTYASQAGGYYAARLAILEHLVSIRKQATVVSIREITPEYVVPAGVWVVREAARTALSQQPTVFSSKDEVLKWLETVLIRPVNDFLIKSHLLGQQSLEAFFF